jgi:hypothetical protein
MGSPQQPAHEVWGPVHVSPVSVVVVPLSPIDPVPLSAVVVELLSPIDPVPPSLVGFRVKPSQAVVAATKRAGIKNLMTVLSS